VPKQKLEETKKVEIEGLKEFPLDVLGLSPESIERSEGHIKIPIELLPFIKIVKTPPHIRKQRAKYKRDYELRLNARKSQEALKGKLKKPSRTIKRQDK